MAVAALLDRTEYGEPRGFGSGQSLLAVAGLSVSLIGALGARRAVDMYRGVAVLFMNTLALFLGLELVAIAVTRLGIFPSPWEVVLAKSQESPYYAEQQWAGAYWEEAERAESYRYRPYVVWGHRPFSGETIHISEEGIRNTPGADCRPGSYTVFAFGGSSMWGWGSPDWATIPAYLQAGLEVIVPGSVCVANFGEDGFVSTRSLMMLITQLQSGTVPDAVIFYDGVNEVYAANESGRPGVHSGLAPIAAEFEAPEHPFVGWVRTSRQYSLYEQLFLAPSVGEAPGAAAIPGSDADDLAVAVAQRYLGNYRIAGALARDYGFEYYFFWQPHLGTDAKPLTAEEQALRAAIDPTLVRLAAEVYEQVALSVPGHEHLWNISDAFEGEHEQIWIDAWGHVTPEGNRLVAAEILSVLSRGRSRLRPAGDCGGDAGAVCLGGIGKPHRGN